jgi:pilus assembly protein CpaF
MVLMGMDMPLQAIRQQIASAIDIIIHIGRLKDGSRKLLEINELLGMKDGEIQLHPVYRWEDKAWRRVNRIEGEEKMEDMGYLEEYKVIYDS